MIKNVKIPKMIRCTILSGVNQSQKVIIRGKADPGRPVRINITIAHISPGTKPLVSLFKIILLLPYMLQGQAGC